ncbi:hypothetical protein ABIF86_000354 [Bradyrhizobium japonicum]
MTSMRELWPALGECALSTALMLPDRCEPARRNFIAGMPTGSGSPTSSASYRCGLIARRTALAGLGDGHCGSAACARARSTIWIGLSIRLDGVSQLMQSVRFRALTLKTELHHHQNHATRDETRCDVFTIERVATRQLQISVQSRWSQKQHCTLFGGRSKPHAEAVPQIDGLRKARVRSTIIVISAIDFPWCRRFRKADRSRPSVHV